MPSAQRLADEAAERGIAREAKLGSRVACGKGCAICCRYLVRISIPEVIDIGEKLRDMPTEERSATEERFRRAQDAIQNGGLLDALREALIRQPGDLSYDHRAYELSRSYARLGLACPFLIDESCSIYSWRPTVCRQYNVTSAPLLCQNPFTENVRRIPSGRPVSEILATAAAELLKEPYELVALPLALDWLKAHRNIAERQWSMKVLLHILKETE